MSITAKTLVKLTKACSFDYLGETVNLHYYPAALGQEGIATANRLQAAMTASVASGDEATVTQVLLDTGAWLCSILAWWDYLEDDGVTMQPLTPENLAKQMTDFSDFMQAVVTACQQDRTAGNANGTPSSANSPTTSPSTDSSASEAASLTPSDSSSLPDGSTEPQPSNG